MPAFRQPAVFASGRSSRSIRGGSPTCRELWPGELAKPGKGERYYLKCVYSLSRRVELGGNPFAIRRYWRVPDRETEQRLDRAFLAITVLTSVTGFLFPFHKFLPSHAVGIVSLLVLAVTIPGLYFFHLRGPWRHTYVIGAVFALYLNVFVLIAQFS